jgi:hypothetical protein
MWDARSCIFHSLSKQGQGGYTFCLTYNMKSQHEKIGRSTWNIQPPCYTFVRWMWDARSCILHCHGKGKQGVGTTCLKNNMKSHHGEITHALKQIFHKHPKHALKQIFHKHLWKKKVFFCEWRLKSIDGIKIAT